MEQSVLLWLSFLAGIYAPLGSPCAIVLYPGYLAFLARTGQGGDPPRPYFGFGLAIAAGVLISLLAGGILFGLAIRAGGPQARSLLSLATALLLLVFSLFAILDIRAPGVPGRLPVPGSDTPYRAAFLFGLFLGIVILPCNAVVILFLLTLASSVSTAGEAVTLFIAFGCGMILPLLVLAGISRLRSRRIAGFLSVHRLAVQRVSGAVMLVIAVWSLLLIAYPAVFLP